MKQKNLFLILAIICSLFFILLTVCVYNAYQFLQSLNTNIATIFTIQHSFLSLIQIISFVGSSYFVFVIFCIVFIILFLYKKYPILKYSPILLGGACIHYTLKRVLEIQRPENSFLLTPSYPSGHTFGAALLYWTLAFLLWKNHRFLAYLFIILPFIIGLTRILLGVHWFTDVLGALLLAGATVCFFIWGIKTKKE